MKSDNDTYFYTGATQPSVNRELHYITIFAPYPYLLYRYLLCYVMLCYVMLCYGAMLYLYS